VPGTRFRSDPIVAGVLAFVAALDRRNIRCIFHGVPVVTRRPRGSLTADEVVVAAGALIDDGGVDALSMRRIADRLGVNPMTLYSRFANRDDLVAAVVAERLKSAIAPAVPSVLATPAADGDQAVEPLVAFARSVRDALVGLGPLLAELQGSPRVAESVLVLTDRGLAATCAAGLDGVDAVSAFRSLFWHAVGFAVLQPQLWAHAPALLDGVEIDPTEFPVLARLAPELGQFDGDELFDTTTRALVAGLIGPAGGATPQGEMT